jgi:glycosyltransferase involved in cell wall biosynthesis
MNAESISLSIVIPACNEAATLPIVVSKLRESLGEYAYQIVVVDDGSTDKTSLVMDQLAKDGVIALSHSSNCGKGAALRTAFQHVRGDIVVIQDADLEYDPKDIPKLIQPILEGRADVVFGSRFNGPEQRVHLFWHRVANGWLTWMSNLLNNLDLSDMETGYKAFRKDVLAGIQIRENRFGVEPELTAKIAKQKWRLYEVPVCYYGRDYSEGKKIGFRDAIRAAWCIIRYRFAD